MAELSVADLDRAEAVRNAAPEMLQALEELMRFHEGEGEYNFMSLASLERANAADDAWYLVREKIAAAIAKAKGGHTQARHTV